MKNGLIVEKKQGKGNKMQYMGTMNEENKGIEHIKDMDFLRSYLLEKRDRKYFLGEP